MQEACLGCEMSLVCATTDSAQPLVCPGCRTEWFVARPKEGKSYATNYVETPKGCPKVLMSKACPACQRMHDEGIQINFDIAGGDRSARKRRQKLKEELLEYLGVVRKHLEERGRYEIHPKDLPEWKPEMEE